MTARAPGRAGSTRATMDTARGEAAALQQKELRLQAMRLRNRIAGAADLLRSNARPEPETIAAMLGDVGRLLDEVVDHLGNLTPGPSKVRLQ